MRDRRAALTLAAGLALPAQPQNSEILDFATFREVPVKIRAESVANLHFEQPGNGSEPKHSLGSSGTCLRCSWVWWVKQEYLCPGSREPGLWAWARSHPELPFPCRGGMIQTSEQYQFLHHTLALYASQLPEAGGH